MGRLSLRHGWNTLVGLRTIVQEFISNYQKNRVSEVKFSERVVGYFLEPLGNALVLWRLTRGACEVGGGL